MKVQVKDKQGINEAGNKHPAPGIADGTHECVLKDKDDWGVKKGNDYYSYDTRQIWVLAEQEKEGFQPRVLEWLLKCFGMEISRDILERNDRFIEEALELAQSLNYSAERAHALVDYVFDRPKGEPFQEVGGVMVTLAALCSATGLDMMQDGDIEYARINTPEIIEKIRAKQKSKPTGSALPQSTFKSTRIAELQARVAELEGVLKQMGEVDIEMITKIYDRATNALKNQQP